MEKAYRKAWEKQKSRLVTDDVGYLDVHPTQWVVYNPYTLW